MGISRVGSATGTTSVTLPAHQAGDLIIYFAYRDGSTTVPTIPAGQNWTTLHNSAGANTNSHVVVYKLAAGGSETTGTFTNATRSMAVVYRGVDQTTPVGAHASGGGSSTTLSFTGITLQIQVSTSWVVGFCGHRSTNTSITTAPTGMTNFLDGSDGNADAAAHDTDAAVNSWSTTTRSVGGTSSGWRTHTVEIRSADRIVTGGAGAFTETGQAATPKAGRKADGTAASFTHSGQAATLTFSVPGQIGAPVPLPPFGTLLPSIAALTLTADAAAFVETGQAAGVRWTHVVPGAAGSFTESGQAATLTTAPILTGAVGAFTETGQTAVLRRGLVLLSAAGAYAESGQTATLTLVEGPGQTDYPAPLPSLSSVLRYVVRTTLTSAAGAYTETGQAAALRVTHQLVGAAASYAFTGQVAQLTRAGAPATAEAPAPLPSLVSVLARNADFTLVADAGAYTLVAAPSQSDNALSSAVGAFSLGGQDATLSRTFRSLVSAVGTFTGIGYSAALLRSGGTVLLGAVGAYSAAGQNAVLRVGADIPGAVRAPAPLPSHSSLLEREGVALAADTGVFTFLGAPSQSDSDVTAAVGDVAVSGQAATLRWQHAPLTGGSGGFGATGHSANLLAATERGVLAAVGPFSLDGALASVTYRRAILADVGAFALTGQDAGRQRRLAMAANSGLFDETGRAATFSRSSTISPPRGRPGRGRIRQFSGGRTAQYSTRRP